MIILTKTDLVEKEDLAKKEALMKEFGKIVYTTSTYDDESVKVLRDGLVKLLREEK